MTMLTALLQFFLALFGVDLGASTFSHRSTIEGIQTLYSIATVESGVARFECLASASGRCVYTVFPAACADLPSLAGTRIGRCAAGSPSHFALPPGARREIRGLAIDTLCVRADDLPVRQDCATPVRLAGT